MVQARAQVRTGSLAVHLVEHLDLAVELEVDEGAFFQGAGMFSSFRESVRASDPAGARHGPLEAGRTTCVALGGRGGGRLFEFLPGLRVPPPLAEHAGRRGGGRLPLALTCCRRRPWGARGGSWRHRGCGAGGRVSGAAGLAEARWRGRCCRPGRWSPGTRPRPGGSRPREARASPTCPRGWSGGRTRRPSGRSGRLCPDCSSMLCTFRPGDHFQGHGVADVGLDANSSEATTVSPSVSRRGRGCTASRRPRTGSGRCCTCGWGRTRCRRRCPGRVELVAA